MSQRQIRSAGRSCETIASFLLKTYQILDHHEFQHIVSWDRDNIGFIVKDQVAFTKEILPKYFRHSNFSSFVRQLNMYDFHKVKQDNDNLVFKNPLFRKGDQHLLRQIRRKASKRPFQNSRPHHHRQKNSSQTQKFMNTLKTMKKVVETQMNNSCNNFEHGLRVLDEANYSNNLKLKYLKNLEQNPIKSLDNIFKLKQQCFQYFNKIEFWLNDNLADNTRKIKSINGFISQLQKKEQILPSISALQEKQPSISKVE